MRVNGGFLSGLDVSFSRGLNVVIGPRGVGKTTLLELIRHALGVEHADRRREAERQTFISAVLGDGEVLLDFDGPTGGGQLVVDARGRGRREELITTALVLGQSELESIASSAANRLKLLDLRAGIEDTSLDRGRLETLTRRLFDLREELRLCLDQRRKRDGLLADRAIYSSQEASLIGDTNGPLASSRDALRELERQTTVLAATVDNSDRALTAVRELSSLAQLAAENASSLPKLHIALSSEPAVEVVFAEAYNFLTMARDSIAEVENYLETTIAASREGHARIAEQSAPLRAELEKAEAGLGLVTTQLRNVDAQLAELSENERRIKALEQELARVEAERAEAFDDLEAREEKVFEARRIVAEEATLQVSSSIAIEVRHFADSVELRELLVERLKGTHTRTVLIDALAARVLPRLLLELVERGDIKALASFGELTAEQASRVHSVLDDADSLARLAKVTLRDSVDFLLRDGLTEKSVEALSTGQKCAVTLPIILSERSRSLILDQPEDHLDNAYLVDNVVTGMVRRAKRQVQTIVATHNANIPVLGSADTVFVLSSDGRRGEVVAEGAFDQPLIVSAITKLMEGGSDAFERRYDFYRDHGGLSSADS